MTGPLIVYGDFNCPYSCLASARVDVLLARGVSDIEWRAVDHDPDIPAPSRAVQGSLAEMLRREVTEVRTVTRPHERFPIVVPPVQPNTRLATALFAGVEVGRRHAVRRQIFESLWFDGHDIGQPDLLRAIVGQEAAPDHTLAARWRTTWSALERPLVPTLVLRDGKVSRGLGALRRLADLAEPDGSAART